MRDYNTESLEEMESEKKFHNYFNNPNLTLEFIESHIDENWDFEMLSHEDIMTPEFIISHKDKPWNFNYYKFLKNLTMNQFLEVQDKIEDYETLSRNHNISLEYIFENDNKLWCWFEISKRKDINGKFIDISKPLNFYVIYKNQDHYSVDFLVEHKQRIMFDFEDYVEHLCAYERLKEHKIFIELLYRHI